jgi:hypothetical protein
MFAVRGTIVGCTSFMYVTMLVNCQLEMPSKEALYTFMTNCALSGVNDYVRTLKMVHIFDI